MTKFAPIQRSKRIAFFVIDIVLRLILQNLIDICILISLFESTLLYNLFIYDEQFFSMRTGHLYLVHREEGTMLPVREVDITGYSQWI